jgi:hypothetical protein
VPAEEPPSACVPKTPARPSTSRAAPNRAVIEDGNLTWPV